MTLPDPGQTFKLDTVKIRYRIKDSVRGLFVPAVMVVRDRVWMLSQSSR